MKDQTTLADVETYFDLMNKSMTNMIQMADKDGPDAIFFTHPFGLKQRDQIHREFDAHRTQDAWIRSYFLNSARRLDFVGLTMAALVSIQEEP